MPWSLFIRDHITQMVIEHIDYLVIRDRVVMSSAYQGQSEFNTTLFFNPPTENICRSNVVVEVTPQMP